MLVSSAWEFIFGILESWVVSSSAWVVCIFRSGGLHLLLGLVCICRLGGLHLPLGKFPPPLKIPSEASYGMAILNQSWRPDPPPPSEDCCGFQQSCWLESPALPLATGPIHNRTGQFTTGRANSQPVVVNWTVFGPPHGGIVLTIHDNAIKTNVHISKPQLNFKKNGCELARLCAAAMWSVCRKTKAPINGFRGFFTVFLLAPRQDIDILLDCTSIIFVKKTLKPISFMGLQCTYTRIVAFSRSNRRHD